MSLKKYTKYCVWLAIYSYGVNQINSAFYVHKGSRGTIMLIQKQSPEDI